MPLMQLSALVLPAPLGPMSANSSPAATENDTSSSTVRPPKRRHKCATSSSAIPPPRPAILLDGPVRAALAAGLAEVEFLHVLMALEPLAVAVEHDAAVLHHIGMVGDGQRRRGALLDEQDRNAELVADREQASREIPQADGSEPERADIHETAGRPTTPRTGHCKTPPVAARQGTADPVPKVGEA